MGPFAMQDANGKYNGFQAHKTVSNLIIGLTVIPSVLAVGLKDDAEAPAEVVQADNVVVGELGVQLGLSGQPLLVGPIHSAQLPG